jgi:hypothetical protein
MMTNMCEACPNRAMVNLNRSLGNEPEAVRLERAGCSWWWGMKYTHDVTKLEEVRYECGVRHVAGMIKEQGALVQEALETAQSVRNEVAAGLDKLACSIATAGALAGRLGVLPSRENDLLLITQNDPGIEPGDNMRTGGRPDV